MTYSIEKSRMSRSRYILVWSGDWEYVIRFSDHEARPTYEAMHGKADFEVGSHLHGASLESAIEWIKQKI